MPRTISPSEVVQRLEDQGYKATTPRQIIVDFALRQPGYFSTQEVYDQLRRVHPHIGRATVFRTIELLERVGALESVHLEDGRHGYTVCGQGHHHHLICSRCGRAVEVEGCALGDAIRQLGRENDFTISAHRLEFFGVCGSCRA